MSTLDRSGQTFGKLKIVKRLEAIRTGPKNWQGVYECHCECGNTQEYTATQVLRMKFPACLKCRNKFSKLGRPRKKKIKSRDCGMIYEYENHLIIEDKGKWKVRLSLKENPREIEVTNLRSGQKFITRYNASILSDEDFLKDQEKKGYRVYE